MVSLSSSDAVPLSHSQQRFLLDESLMPGQDDNQVVLAYLLTGPLDAAALALAFDDIVRQHGILRTVYTWDADLGPVQRVLPFTPERTPLVTVPVAGPSRPVSEIATDLCADWWDLPFDLEHRPPLRARLGRLDAERRLLCLSLHHIAFDGKSELILLDDLAAAYAARSRGQVPELPCPPEYHAYARWEAQHVAGWAQKDIPFWRDLLKDERPGVLPVPDADQAVRHEHERLLEAPDVTALLEGVRAARAIPLSALLYGTARALGEVFDVRGPNNIATVSSGRFERSYNAVLGCFVNPMVVPVDDVRTGDPRDGLSKVNHTVLLGLRRARTPFDEVARALNFRRAGLFEVMAALQAPEPAGPFGGEELRFRPVRIRAPRASYGLIVEAEPLADGRWTVAARWRGDLLDEERGRAVVDTLADSLLSLRT